MPAITVQDGQHRYDIEIMGWDGNPYRITFGSVSRTVFLDAIIQRFIKVSAPDWYVENINNHANNYHSRTLGLLATDGTAWTTTCYTESFANHHPEYDLIQFSFHNKRDGFDIENQGPVVGFKAWDGSNWVFRVSPFHLKVDGENTFQPKFSINRQ